jgi:hypothetical protein
MQSVVFHSLIHVHKMRFTIACHLLGAFFFFAPRTSSGFIISKNDTTDGSHKKHSAKEIVFQADFSKPSLSAAFGGSNIDYGEGNVILWASGGGIDVIYPQGSYVPSGPIVGGFGIWSNHRVNSNTAVFKYGVYFPEDFDFVKGGKSWVLMLIPILD